MPPSTATATASRSETILMRAAAMQASDMPIQRIPWVHPSTSVSGCGLPSANAHISSDVYTHEWKNDVHFRRVKAREGRAGSTRDAVAALRGDTSLPVGSETVVV